MSDADDPAAARPRSSRPLRWLRRHGFAAALVFLYCYSFPYFARIRSANELPRIYLVMAMADEGRFAIDTGVRRWGTTADVSPSGGHQYSNKAPGSSMLAVPAYLLLRAVGPGEPSLAAITWVCRFATGVVPTLLFALVLWGFLARWVPSEATRRLAIAGYLLGTMAMPYSVLFFSHQLAAIFAATAWILCVRVIEDDLDERWLLAAGAAAGAGILCDYQAALAALAVAGYVIGRLATRPRRLLRATILATIGAIPPVAALLYYHWRAFGSPWRTGYAASQTFAAFHQRGFLGLDRFRWEAFTGSLVAPDNGLFFLCPMLLLALPGLWLLWRRGSRDHAITIAAVVAGYVLFVSSLVFWRGGWQLGPRYITALLPFAMVPVALALAAAEKHAALHAGAVALVAASIAVYALSCAEFPHFPEKFQNPVHEVTFRLIADGHAPYNAGWLVGLRGLASLVPYLGVLALLVAGAAAAGRRRSLWIATAAGLAAAALLLAASQGIPGGGRVADRAYRDWVAGSMPK